MPVQKIDGNDVLIEHDDATDYQVAVAALAGWRVVYDDRELTTLKYRYVVLRPERGSYNRYYREREAWSAAFEAMQWANEEG